MVQRESPVVQRAVPRHRVQPMRHGPAAGPGHKEHPRQPHRAQSLDPVGILQDACLKAFAGNSGGKAVGGDGMGDGGQPRLGKAFRAQQHNRPFRRQKRGAGAVGVGLGQRDQIMQEGGGAQHLKVAALAGRDPLRIGPDAGQMAKVMRRIGRGGGPVARDQRLPAVRAHSRSRSTAISPSSRAAASDRRGESSPRSA